MTMIWSTPVPLPPRGACLWGLLLVLLAVLPLTAHAEVSSDVRRYILSIHRLIEDLEYERALEQIARAKKVSKGPEDDVAVSLYEGVVLAELSRGRQDEADAAFKAALFLNPDAKLPLSVSPKLRRRFEAVRRKVLSELAARGESPEALKMEDEAPEPPQMAQAPPVVPLAQPVSSAGSAGEVSGSRASLRDRALLPAVAGGALVVAAGVFWGLAEGKKSKLEDAHPDLRSREDARDVADSARSLQTVSVGLLIGGMVGLGAATGMYLLGAPEESVSLRVGTDGTSAFVSGRFP